LASRLVERHADRGELGPASEVGQVHDSFTDAVHASLLAAVSSSTRIFMSRPPRHRAA
jgi:hypothetical protein